MEEREWTPGQLAAENSGSVALDGDQSHNFEAAESEIGAVDYGVDHGVDHAAGHAADHAADHAVDHAVGYSVEATAQRKRERSHSVETVWKGSQQEDEEVAADRKESVDVDEDHRLVF